MGDCVRESSGAGPVAPSPGRPAGVERGLPRGRRELAGAGRRGRVAAAALLLWPLSAGCHLVLGDFETTTSEATSSPSCEEGAFACDSVGTLQQCQNATWVVVAVCEHPAWCREDPGRCQVCEPDSYACEAQQLRQCDATGDAWIPLTDCSAPLVCDETLASCATCKVGSARCDSDGVTIETCNARGTDWLSAGCGAGVCWDEPGDCDYCTSCNDPGRWVCSPCGKVLHCVGAEWVVTDDCGAARQCVIDASGGYCDE
jgi:hypothetical protein